MEHTDEAKDQQQLLTIYLSAIPDKVAIVESERRLSPNKDQSFNHYESRDQFWNASMTKLRQASDRSAIYLSRS